MFDSVRIRPRDRYRKACIEIDYIDIKIFEVGFSGKRSSSCPSDGGNRRDHEMETPFEPPPPTEIHTWVVLFRATRALSRVAAAAFEPEALGESDFHVLEVLLHRGAQPVNAIGVQVSLTPGSISVAVDRLHRRGLVSRVEDPADRRSRIVDLTEAGRELIVPVLRRHQETIAELVGVLSPEERVQLEALLKKLGKHAEAAMADSSAGAIRGRPGRPRK